MDTYIVLLIITLYLISIITIESLIYVKEKWGVKKEILLSLLYTVSFIAYLYFSEASDLAIESKSVLLAVNYIFTVTVTMSIILVLLRFLEKSKTTIAKHVSANILALVVAILYPFFALYTSCYTGLDCL